MDRHIVSPIDVVKDDAMDLMAAAWASVLANVRARNPEVPEDGARVIAITCLMMYVEHLRHTVMRQAGARELSEEVDIDAEDDPKKMH